MVRPMRRIVLELPREDFVRLKGDLPFYAALTSLEVLQVLRSGPGGASSVVLLHPKDPHQSFERLAHLVPARLTWLESGEGTFTCLMKFQTRSTHAVLGLKPDQGYFVPPIEVVGDTARMTFVGSSADISRLLAGLRRSSLRYRTRSISDLRLSPQSPLNALTDKQRRVVSAAYERGYYDRPRRVSSQALARSLGMSSSNLVNHRLKAEQRLLAVILNRENSGPLRRPG
jgi:predicted DNA binding protein